MTERYHPDTEQVAFADSVGKSLASILPLSRLHESVQESAPTWTALNELGVLDIGIPEEQGGSGLGATEEALIVHQLGRCGAGPSVLATIATTHLRAADGSVPAPSGTRVAAAYRHNGRTVIVDDAAAELVLVRNRDRAAGSGGAHNESGSTALYRKPGNATPLDPYLWSSSLSLLADLGQPLAVAGDEQVTRLRLLDAAALAGLAHAALAMGVAYAGMREQFGRPIGTFQAVKHHCANMALAARCAADQVSFAAVALDDSRTDAVLQVEHAFYVAASAALDNAAKNIQVHGGIGFSDEADPHHVLKRARLLVDLAGGVEAALGRIANTPPVLG